LVIHEVPLCESCAERYKGFVKNLEALRKNPKAELTRERPTRKRG